MPENETIVSETEFVRTVRDHGITTIDSVNELIDNSFDASADNVYIHVGRDEKERLYMAIEDDGSGIPVEKLKKSMSFGGRIQGRSDTTGKFGWGLPASACCQSTRTEIYTKTKQSENFYFNYLDIQELKDNKGILPDNREKSPPSNDYKLEISEESNSGTVVILKNLDRPQYKTVEVLEDKIKDNVARVHRKLLSSGKDIHVNGEKVEFTDPLMLMDGFKGEEKVGRSEEYGEIEVIEFDDIYTENGEKAQIKIKLAKLPLKSLVGETDLKKKFKIDKGHQGFYLIRKGREIAGGHSLRLFRKHDTLNYFRGEIIFPPKLDEKFGIQTNKSRFSLDEDVREEIEDRVSKVIAQLRNEIETERPKINEEKKKKIPGRRESERIASEVAQRLLPSGYSSSGEKKEKEQKELEEEKKEKIKDIKESKIVSGDEEEELIQETKNRYESDIIFDLQKETLGSGNFYEIRHKGKKIEVVLNNEHEFYNEIFNEAKENYKLRVGLEFFLFTLATAEDRYWDKDTVKQFYEDQRSEWSQIMKKFLQRSSEDLFEE